MRHGKKFNHLGRKTGHRKALLRNLAIALIEHKRITTTLAKARALRVFIEPLITKSKSNTMHSRRVVFSYLQNKDAVKELFGPIANKVADRPGGYVRVIKTGFRRSDASEMAMIELVDYNDVYSTENTEKAGGGKRRRRRKKGSGGDQSGSETAAAVAEKEAEEVVETAEEVTGEVVDEASESTGDNQEETTDAENKKEDGES